MKRSQLAGRAANAARRTAASGRTDLQHVRHIAQVAGLKVETRTVEGRKLIRFRAVCVATKSGLPPAFGAGATLEAAAHDLLRCVVDRRLVYGAASRDRLEIVIAGAGLTAKPAVETEALLAVMSGDKTRLAAILDGMPDAAIREFYNQVGALSKAVWEYALHRAQAAAAAARAESGAP